MNKTLWVIFGFVIITINVLLMSEEEDPFVLTDSARTALIVENIVKGNDNAHSQNSSVQNSASLPERTKVVNPITISAGVGIEGITVGQSEDDFLKVYPNFEITIFDHDIAESGKYLTSKESGISVYAENGLIRTLFLYFIYPEFSQFPGETAKGINILSSAKDVISTYGIPEKDIESQHLYGRIKASDERTLIYQSKGIMFTFYDEVLADIRVFKPETQSKKNEL
jgi:hypothetical protein